MDEHVAGHLYCSNWIATKLSEFEVSRILNLKKINEVTFEKALHLTHVNNKHENSNLILISPKIDDWSLIMGSNLIDLELSIPICNALSRNQEKVFCFGIDFWSAYHAWIFSKNGAVKRYFQFVDEEITEHGETINFEKEVDIFEPESIFELSAKLGCNMEKISRAHLMRQASLWSFNEKLKKRI